jgi:hypothetical protein
MTLGPIWGNRNRTKKSQNIKSSSEVTYCKNIHEIISLQGKKCKKFNFFQNQNDTCAHLFTLVMKFHDRQSSERCIRKLISHHCLDKTRPRWNDLLFLITDDRDFRPQTCTNGFKILTKW